MADEDKKIVDGEGAAVVYVETVNNYGGPNVILTANDVKAYTTAQADQKFTVPIASATVAGKVKVGAGLTIDANGVLGTNSSAPDWSAITNKPSEFPPNKAGTTVVGGVKVGTGLSIAADGTLSSNAAAPDWANITNKPAAYPPTKASATQIGGVKQGSGIFIDPETGTINADGSLPTWDQVKDKPTEFPPPIASYSVLGGVKEGTNIEIDAEGTISATVQWDTLLGKPAEFPPVIATESVRGGVYVGDGLQADNNGVLSLRLAKPNDIGGVIPGATLATDAVSGRLDVVPASKDNLGAVKIGDTLYVDDNGYLEANPGAISPATADTLGGIKVGRGLLITEEGVLSAATFTNRKVFTNNGFYGSNAEWTMPDGISFFRVRVQGAGSNGGWANVDASKGPGGGGGGGGAYMDTIFLADKFEKGSVFSIACGAPNGGKKGGTSSFFLKGGGVGIGAEGGTGGEDGGQQGPIDKGYACGGEGGKPIQNGVDLTRMLPPSLAFGADGMPGFTTKTPKGDKTVGGAGGASFSSPSYHGGQGGPGFGSTGGGEANGSTGVAWGGGSYVIIDW